MVNEVNTRGAWEPRTRWEGPRRAGAFVKRKGRMFVVNLLMIKANGRPFDTPYGTYKDEDVARKTCWQHQKVSSCQACPRTRRECDFSVRLG